MEHVTERTVLLDTLECYIGKIVCLPLPKLNDKTGFTVNGMVQNINCEGEDDDYTVMVHIGDKKYTVSLEWFNTNIIILSHGTTRRTT